MPNLYGVDDAKCLVQIPDATVTAGVSGTTTLVAGGSYATAVNLTPLGAVAPSMGAIPIVDIIEQNMISGTYVKYNVQKIALTTTTYAVFIKAWNEGSSDADVSYRLRWVAIGE